MTVIYSSKHVIDKKPDNSKLKSNTKNKRRIYFSNVRLCKIPVDSYRFLQDSLDHLVKTVNEEDFKILKKEFPDNYELLNKKLAYSYEYFNRIRRL